MRKLAFVLSMVVMFFLSGCAFSREERIHQIQSQHPQWDQTAVERVAAGRVETGMTEEMVATILGKPGRVTREGETPVWVYMESKTDSMGGYYLAPTFFVSFKDGRVAATKGDQRRVVTPLE